MLLTEISFFWNCLKSDWISREVFLTKLLNTLLLDLFLFFLPWLLFFLGSISGMPSFFATWMAVAMIFSRAVLLL